jgi:hypothetical protein
MIMSQMISYNGAERGINPAADKHIEMIIAPTGADINGVVCSKSVPAAEEPRSKARRGMPATGAGAEKREALVVVV